MFCLVKFLEAYLFLICCVYCNGKSYKNYTLFQGIPQKEEHLSFFKNMANLYKEIIFWQDPGIVGIPVDFVLGPDDKQKFLKDAERQQLNVTTLIEDVQSAFDEQTVSAYVRRKMDSFGWQNFYKIDDIYSWLDDLHQAYRGEVKVMSIGKTYEKRQIKAVRLKLKGAKVRSTVIIEGGIHAREWIAPAFVTYLIHELIHAKHSKVPHLKDIAMSHEWYLVPVLNPDGYQYTHTEDRMWRKNRKYTGHGHYGIDINRNFDSAYGTVGISNKSKSDTYCGEKAFSELESKAMAKLVTDKSKNLKYYFAFHSYGQYMIMPYAYSTSHFDNFEEVKTMCEDANKKISEPYGTEYTIGTAFDTVGYITSGVSGCWVKETFKVPYVVTFELRDKGKRGFALPPKEILPTCEETMLGLLELLKPKKKKKKQTFHNETVKDDKGRNYLDKIVVLICNLALFILVGVDI